MKTRVTYEGPAVSGRAVFECDEIEIDTAAVPAPWLDLIKSGRVVESLPLVNVNFLHIERVNP